MSKITLESFSAENPEAFECEHLMVTDLANLRATLSTYGAAIVPSVLSATECGQAVEKTNQFFGNLTRDMAVPFNPSDKASYRTLTNMHRLHSMLYQGYSIGQAQASWDVRQHPRIHDAFSVFWNTPELLVSMDGMAYHVPPELVVDAKGREGSPYGWFKYTWFHTDQSFLRSELECIQGQVVAFDVNPGDATLCILEGSHNHHAEFGRKFGVKDKADWFALQSRGKERGKGYLDFFLQEKACTMRRIVAPKGSLILWDSRTIHCGVEPLRNRPQPNFRCVYYVCMTPRSLCDEKNMLLRQKAFQEMSSTSHWPHRVNIFPTLDNGRFTKHPLDINLEMSYPELTVLGKRLLLGSDNVHVYESLVSTTIERPKVAPDGRPERKSKKAPLLVATEVAESKEDILADSTDEEEEEVVMPARKRSKKN